MKKYLHFIVPLVAVVLCSFFLLTTLDHKVYDLFLRAVPSLEEDPSVLVVKIDDVSMERVGLFPWTRDIIGRRHCILAGNGRQNRRIRSQLP